MKTVKKTRKCPECGGAVRPGSTELTYDLRYRVRISNVTANVCSRCGEAFVSGRVASEVNRLVNRVIEDVESFAKSQPQTEEGTREKEIAVAV